MCGEEGEPRLVRPLIERSQGRRVVALRQRLQEDRVQQRIPGSAQANRGDPPNLGLHDRRIGVLPLGISGEMGAQFRGHRDAAGGNSIGRYRTCGVAARCCRQRSATVTTSI